MRFTLVTETYPPEVNGVALTVASLEGGLRAQGHDVCMVRPRQPGHDDAPGDHLLVRGAALPRYPGLRFGLPSGGALRALWRRERPDAVYVATEGPLGWSAVGAARSLGIPVGTGFHTRFDDYVGRYATPLLSPLVFAGMRRFHNRADATIVPTDELAGFLRGRGFRRVELLRRAVDTSLFDPTRRDQALRATWGLRDEALAVIHVGRIAPEKNLDLAVRAFRAIQCRRPEARFVWVGDGPSRAALAAANPDFVFAGVQRGEALARHFASADLFLFPSLSETFGNVTLEAMASGVPTVAFDYGAAREHLRGGEHGAAVPFGDTADFVEAARILAADDTLRARQSRAAREAVLHLSPDAVSRRFAELLGELAGARALRPLSLSRPA
ncbi:MAG: glycosyltransferase family 4 protein [Rehaibacterium terrae]|uniref:glycosyltransferase family 4 protein n=1 Tax=Rehaibacterium terrae TaxID=1341696 RepID=UPI00391AB834